MKIDDLFGKAPLLEPPNALKTKVTESVERGGSAAPDEGAPVRAGTITRYFFTKRAVLSLATVAAALMLTFRIFPGAHVATEPDQVAGHSIPEEVVSDDEINEFVEETLSQVFRADPGVEVAYDDELMDIDTYILSQFEEIFWINGGNNA